jgi:hypothetical protein
MRALGVSRTSVATGGILGANWARDPLWKNARAVPSLDLRFAENKSLTDAKTGASLVTFTRASTGTFVSSNGVLQSATTDEARFDHNPTTGESLGLLVEEARTNLLTYSEDFGNVIWLYTSASSSTNTTSSPDGATTADTITSAGTAVVSQSIAKTASAITYTASVFVKGSITGLSFTIDDGATTNRGRCVFNLSTGTLTSSANDGSFTGTSGSITAYSNNWYKLILTTTTNSSTLIARHRLFWSGGGTSIDVWGAQLETGAFPTSYIPTTAATVTRAADVASITGSNFSSWYNQTEGTVFTDFILSSATLATFIATLSDGTNNNRQQLYSETSSFLLRTSASGVASNNTIGTSAANVPSKICYALASGQTFASDNGTAVTVNTQALPSNLSQLGVGLSAVGGASGAITIKRLTYWPVRLANPTLQSITTP